jgi:hypothetical protein
MLVIFPILMCTVSLILHNTIDVTVYNQYSDIELVSLAYFCNCETYDEYSIEREDIGSMMKIGFRFDLEQDEPGGILIYKVQRNTKSDHQSSTDTTSAEAVEDTSKIMQFLVTWKVTCSWKMIIAFTMLVEHSNELVLDEDKIAHLYDKVNDMPIEMYKLFSRYDGVFKSTWLICDKTVLEATYELTFEKGIELKITVSEGVENKYTMKPLWIDPTGQVLSLMVIYSY